MSIFVPAKGPRWNLQFQHGGDLQVRLEEAEVRVPWIDSHTEVSLHPITLSPSERVALAKLLMVGIDCDSLDIPDIPDIPDQEHFLLTTEF